MSNPTGEQQSQAGSPPGASQVWYGPIEEPPPRTPAEEAAHQLDILRRELNYYAQHLRKARQTQLGHYEQLGLISGQQAEREQRLKRQESQLAADRVTFDEARRKHEEQLATDRAAFDRQRHEWEQERRQAQERLAAEQAQLQQAREAYERERQQAREAFENEHRAAQDRAAAEHATAGASLAAAQQQLKEERERWAAEHAQQLADLNRGVERLAQEKKDLAWSEAALNKQREQLQKLRAELTDLQQATQARDQAAQSAAEQELAAIRQQLAEKDQLLVDKDRQLAEKEQQLADQDELLIAARQKVDREVLAFQEHEAELRNELTALRRQLDEAREAPPPVVVAPTSASTPVPVSPPLPHASQRLAAEFSLDDEQPPVEEEQTLAAEGLEEAVAARAAEEAPAAHDEFTEDEEATESAEAVSELEDEPLEPAVVGSDTVKANDFSGPIDFENGALVLETVRGMIRADRQCLNEDLLKIQMRAGGALPVTREKALLAERRVQLELLREEIRRDLDRLNQETADREPQAAPSKNAKSEGAKPGPTKTRGTFMGLRRWLGG